MNRIFLHILVGAMVAIPLIVIGMVAIKNIWPWGVKKTVDSFGKATEKKDATVKDRVNCGALDPEEALHLALQWRFRRDALLLGFSALILICATIIIVNQSSGCRSGASKEKSQNPKASQVINQTFNSTPTNNIGGNIR